MDTGLFSGYLELLYKRSRGNDYVRKRYNEVRSADPFPLDAKNFKTRANAHEKTGGLLVIFARVKHFPF